MCLDKANILQLGDAPSPGAPGWPQAYRTEPGADVLAQVPVPPDVPAGASGSRRRRLWDLTDQAHCPVIGVCLPMQVVRKLVNRVRGPLKQALDDYDSHCMAVTEGKRRSPLAELVQKELDQRHALTIREASRIKTEAGLLAWWRDAAEGPKLAQVLWATLTHPCCTSAIEYRVLGHVHMLQHQVGMACRVDQARFEALLQENAALATHLAGAQERCTRQAAEHAARVEELERQLMQARAELLARDTACAHLQEQIASLRASMPDLPSRQVLARKQDELVTHNQALRRDCQQLREQVAQQADRIRDLMAKPPQADASQAVAANAPDGAGVEALRDRSVLCVGGRASIVPIYRELIELEGARFLHHDGGEEDGSAQLDATLAAADLVICQTGCISHNAYWRVKDHCKRTGKRCVFVESPSRSALSRALGEVTQGPAAVGPACTPNLAQKA